MYHERTPLLAGVSAGVLLTLPLGFLLFFATSQPLGKTDTYHVIPRCAFGTFCAVFIAAYLCAAVYLRRRHGVPVLNYSLRRLSLAVFLAALNLHPNVVPQVHRWEPYSSAADIPVGVAHHGWPLIFHETTLLASGGEIPSLRAAALAFNLVFLLLLFSFVLFVRAGRRNGKR